MNAAPPQVLLVSMRSPLDPGHGDVAVLRARIAMLRAHARVTVLCFGPGGRVWPGDDGVRLVEVAPSRAGALRGMAWGLARGLPVQVGRCRQPALVAAFRALTAQTRFAAIGFVTLRPAFALEPDLAGLPGRRWLEMIDLLSENMRAIGAREGGWRRHARAFEARRLARLEARAPGLFDPVHLVNPGEAARDARYSHLPLCLPAAAICPPGPDPAPGAPLRVAVSGNFGYLPNREAALFAHEAVRCFARETVPGGRGARLVLLGRGALALAASLDPAPEAAEPPDMIAALAGCDVALCGVFTATGAQNKLLEAAAAGLIVLATPGPAAVLGLEPGRHVLPVTDAASAAAHLAAIAADPGRFRPLRLAAQDHLRRTLSQEALAGRLARALGLVTC